MTAINTLISYNSAGKLQFAPLGANCADISESIYSSAAPVDMSNRERHNFARVVIFWRDLASRKPELPETSAGFWTTHSLDRLAVAQNVPLTSEISNWGGIWPQDDLGDDFETAVRHWRDQDAERRQ